MNSGMSCESHYRCRKLSDRLISCEEFVQIQQRVGDNDPRCKLRIADIGRLPGSGRLDQRNSILRSGLKGSSSICLKCQQRVDFSIPSRSNQCQPQAAKSTFTSVRSVVDHANRQGSGRLITTPADARAIVRRAEAAGYTAHIHPSGPGGPIVAMVEDPDGYLVELYQRPAAAK